MREQMKKIGDLTKTKSKLTRDQMSVFDGIMLSDGYLHKLYSPISNSNFSMCSKYFGFSNAIKKLLPLSWSYFKHYYLPVDKRTGKIYSGWYLGSKRDIFLTEQRKRWYPNEKKIVPKDIKLTPKCLLWWYIGDGHLARKPRSKSRRVVLACEGFKERDVKFLINLLKKKLGEFVYKEGGNIVISRTSLCRFIKIVGTKSPVPEYKYKFDFGQYKNSNYLQKSYSVRKSVQNFKERMVLINSKPVLCIETGEIFSSATAASKRIKKCVSTMSQAILKKTECVGKHWKYVEQEIKHV